MLKVKLGWSTELLCDEGVAAQLCVLLTRCSDVNGRAAEFTVEDGNGIEAEKMAAKHKEAAQEELEKQGKSWLQQYERAERLQSEINAMKADSSLVA